MSRDGGRHFKPGNTFIGLDLYGIAIKDETWVVAAGNPWQGHGSLLTSSDGLNWEITYDMGLETLYDVAANPTAFVAVGVVNELWSGGAMILRSQDGRTWTHTGSASGPGDWPWEWQSVAWDGGRFVAAGSGGAVATSGDGWGWHLIGGGHLTDHTFFGAASDGQSLVAVGWTGAIAVSHDGETVTMVRPGYEEWHLFDVAWGGGTFVAVGSGGSVLTSATGDHWQEQSSGTSLDLHGVRFTGEEFVAVGEGGAALISDDGLSWRSIGPAGEGSLRDVVQPVSEMTVVGDHGLVMRSACSDPDLPPVPRFAWRPTLPEVGIAVRFTDLSLGNPTSWRWDFGDGGVAEGPHATHAFAEPGSWPVTLTTENDNGAATAFAPVTVRPFCGAPPATEVSAPATSPSGEPYEVSWIPTLQGDERGEYVFHESPDPEFLELDGWGTWIHTSTQVTHRWTEAGSFYHRVLSINYCPDGHYWSPPSETVRVDIEPDVTDLGDHLQVITAAAHGSGIEDTSWVTDVVVHNPDRHPAPAYLFLLPRDGGGDPVGSPRHWVEPGQSLHLDDAVADLRDPGYGAVLVASDRSLIVGSRTFNDQEDGSYGQFIEGVSIDSSDRGDGGARLIQLTQNERYRTNLALANPLPEATVVTVDLHRADGELLGSSDYSLPGLSSLLDVEVLADTGHDDVADAYAVVSSASSDGRWTALASVVDNASGDPVAFPALTTHPRHRVVARDDVPVIGHRAWYDILFAGDVYVASGQGAIAWSRDGVSWHSSDGIDSGTALRHLSWNGSQILAVNRYWVYSSDDGISWTGSSFNGDGYDTVAWDGTRWVGLGGGGADWTEVGFSRDGVSWEQQRVDGIRVRNIIWAGDRFVAAGASGLATSADALSWQTIATFDGWVSDLAWNGRQLIALGAHEVYSSTDFENFISQTIDREPSRVVWAEDQWVVAAGASTTDPVEAFLISGDGMTWETVPNPGPWLHPAEGMTWDGNTVLTVDFRRRLTWLVSDGADATVPAVAHLGGFGGSQWRSDVELHNPGFEPVVCALELMERDSSGLEPARTEMTVAATSSIRLTDVLATEFGSQGAGALRVRPDRGTLMVTSRTFADDPDGTYGQMVPGLRTTDAIHGFETGRLIQLRHSPRLDDGFRTNIGLVASCRGEMEVTVNLYLGSGHPLGVETVNLPAMGTVQLNNVFAPFTDEVVEDGFAVLSSATPLCAFYAYGSVVDNRTHDPTLVPARPWSRSPWE